MSVDLIARLTDAAAEAIANERQSLGYDVNRLKDITIELTVANNGAIVEGTCYVERKVKGQRSCS